MFLLDSTDSVGHPDLVYSASDLVIASQCEYQLLRKLDEKLGRVAKLDIAEDQMLVRTAELGDVHEHRVLEEYRQKFGAWDAAAGTGVYELDAAAINRDSLTDKHDETIASLEACADVVFQGSFFDGQFHGRSDFLVNTGDGVYAVYDTKLARHAKVEALLQLAAYGDQLIQAGLAVHPEVTLVLGTGAHSNHSLHDLLPVFRERRQRLLEITATHRNPQKPVEWNREDITSCGRCDYCQEEVHKTRDLLLVANMSVARRKKLRDQGIYTIDDLASADIPAGNAGLRKLQDQARMQTGTAHADGEVSYPDHDGAEQTLRYRVLDDHTLDRLPSPSNGDIFFDFEGDPLWQDEHGRWGIEYLFGVVEPATNPGAEPVFKPFWAHNRAEERRALVDFLDYVEDHRRTYPDMKIYHYAAYEKTALRNLSAQHGVGEEVVDQWLREGVLFDLLPMVRNSIRISENSYSIKKLEPLYMGTELRSGEITDAGASVVAYAIYCQQRDAGEQEQAAKTLAGIEDYNHYDCLSTLKLRDWLLRLAQERGIEPRQLSSEAVDVVRTTVAANASPEETRLLGYLEAVPGRELSDDDQAVAMVAAAVNYHRRENKQFWWAHFDRLESGLEEWEDTTDVFTVQRAEVVSDWEKPNSRSNPVRHLKLTGMLGAGSNYKAGKTFFRIYEEPDIPEDLRPELTNNSIRAGWFETEILEVDHDGVHDVLVVKEKLKRGGLEYEQVPIALSPGRPIGTVNLEAALAELASVVSRQLPELPNHPGLDILRRRASVLATLPGLPEVQDGPTGYVDAIAAAVADLDHSYLAVQGPPGTGKTYVGSHVIKQLVANGWKVGVVGQSHAVVENLIKAAIEAGVPEGQVAKKTDSKDLPWSRRGENDVATLLSAEGGALVGGTAWTMAGQQVPAGSLDLLVIDEAGQFCLADTLAVSGATRRLLLLGDPQQLPQVSQGKHPEPVNESALGWLAAGHPTLPGQMGYFLADSWRMHPELCGAVSRLSYEGRLESAEAAARRHLEGVPAGVECVMVPHTGNSTSSTEEAVVVEEQVRGHLGLKWTDGQETPASTLEEADILVVAPYNAQVQAIREQLSSAGLSGIRVGTVDKFQGQQAVVVIVSMACSNASEAPRGIEFLLNRNRVNVAISRGQWRAVIIRSPELTKHMPKKPAALEQLGAFVGLCTSREPGPQRSDEAGK
ncbi:TM0106 family RecB-like putative nuclease [Arthrobacter pigmenti]